MVLVVLPLEAERAVEAEVAAAAQAKGEATEPREFKVVVLSEAAAEDGAEGRGYVKGVLTVAPRELTVRRTSRNAVKDIVHKALQGWRGPLLAVPCRAGLRLELPAADPPPGAAGAEAAGWPAVLRLDDGGGEAHVLRFAADEERRVVVALLERHRARRLGAAVAAGGDRAAGGGGVGQQAREIHRVGP